jgi:hypothetical protein
MEKGTTREWSFHIPYTGCSSNIHQSVNQLHFPPPGPITDVAKHSKAYTYIEETLEEIF